MLSPASYTNYYVRSYSIDGQDSHGSNYDIAASVNIATMENKGIVAIGEQSALKTGGDINIHSEAATEAVSATGNGGEFLAYSETNGTGIGASFAWQDISADSLVLAGKNVKMQAGAASERAKGDIALNTNAAVEDIAIIYCGGKADRSGLAGSFNIQDGGSNSLILVDDEATLEAPGAVSLRAANSMTAANIVGGLALGSAKSKATVGAGFALNRLYVNSMALVGRLLYGSMHETLQNKLFELRGSFAGRLRGRTLLSLHRNPARALRRQPALQRTRRHQLCHECGRNHARGEIIG